MKLNKVSTAKSSVQVFHLYPLKIWIVNLNFNCCFTLSKLFIFMNKNVLKVFFLIFFHLEYLHVDWWTFKKKDGGVLSDIILWYGYVD